MVSSYVSLHKQSDVVITPDTLGFVPVVSLFDSNSVFNSL
jgi:hypothetical protein